MNLFDPNRPKLPNSRPTWVRDHIVIGNLEIFPLESGLLEISIWLPIRDQTFASMRFTKTLEPIALHGFIQNFINDPEETCEFFFKTETQNENLNPELRNHIRYQTDPNSETKLIKNNSISSPNSLITIDAEI